MHFICMLREIIREILKRVDLCVCCNFISGIRALIFVSFSFRVPIFSVRNNMSGTWFFLTVYWNTVQFYKIYRNINNIYSTFINDQNINLTELVAFAINRYPIWAVSTVYTCSEKTIPLIYVGHKHFDNPG